jgi:hypothetical protein
MQRNLASSSRARGSLMNADDLARSVAEGMEPDVVKSTDAALRGEATRAWGVTEAAAVGGFLVEICRFAWEIYKDTKTKPELLAMILASVKRPAQISEAKAESVASQVVDKLTAARA